MTQTLPIMGGLDFIRGPKGTPLVGDRAYAERLGNRRMPADLKRAGFDTVVVRCNDYYRVSYAGQKEAR